MAASKGPFSAIVVIGPSGNGKSTLAGAIADRLGWEFIEGDEHHPPANIAKMSRGEPLTDADRLPFLESIGNALAKRKAVAACSALKREYRERLTETARCPVLYVLPKVSREELLQRMQDRSGHFMPPSLLESQLAVFEAPQGDEPSLTLDGADPPARLAEQVEQFLHNIDEP